MSFCQRLRDLVIIDGKPESFYYVFCDRVPAAANYAAKQAAESARSVAKATGAAGDYLAGQSPYLFFAAAVFIVTLLASLTIRRELEEHYAWGPGKVRLLRNLWIIGSFGIALLATAFWTSPF